LPVTTLADYCYYGMFHGCTSLTEAPTLPSTALTKGCYSWMFEGCTSLTQSPSLPATTLADNCYNDMFHGCTSLTQAPNLPATTLAYHCYDKMFLSCTSLTQAPNLPATTLARGCYYNMFGGCPFTRIPELPATTLADSCYYAMFFMCTSLIVNTEAPGEDWQIPNGATAANNWNSSMFLYTGGTFTGDPEIGVTYYIASSTPSDVEEVKTMNITVYSNNGRIFVNGAEGENICVYDMNGRLVAETMNASENQVFAIELAGVYFVRVNSKKSVKVII